MSSDEFLQFEVSRYVVHLHNVCEMAEVSWIAQITCYGDDAPAVLRVRFQPAGEEVASNTYDPETGHAYLFRPAAEYPWYIDLLRNEGPVFVTIIPSDPDLHELSTLDEPVGEGEGRA